MGLVALCFTLAWASAPAAAAAPDVSLSPDAQAHLGLQLTSLAAARRAAQIDAFAKVLDPGPLAQLQSDLLTAESAALASKAEALRMHALQAAGGSVANKDVEAAQSQAEQDAEKVDLLRRRVGLEWGPGVARLSPARRAALLRDLAAGNAALVHVDTPSNEGQAGAKTVDIDIGAGGESAHGLVLGPARAAEPRLQSSGLIVEVTGKSAVLLSVGLTQSAHINTTSAVQGVVIPRSAVIRYEGSDWAYVSQGGGGFERRLMQDPIVEDKGLFVAGGFKPGEQVVAHGAAELFATERAQATRSR